MTTHPPPQAAIADSHSLTVLLQCSLLKHFSAVLVLFPLTFIFIVFSVLAGVYFTLT